MKKYNPANERIKRDYFAFLKEARRQSENSVDAAAMAIARFEADTRLRDFKAFHFEQAIAFKHRLARQESRATGGKLSKATLNATLAHLKRFFQWLALQPGYKSRLNYPDAEYFNLSEKDSRVATARRQRAVPTIEQIKHVLATMPNDSAIDRRNRALIAFALLSGARDSAIASIKLKHVDLSAGNVFQDAREVNTKFSKSFTTTFFPVGEDVRQIVADWVVYLREVMLWGNDDPLFPSTMVSTGPTRQFRRVGLTRTHWSNAGPIRGIFKAAFAEAGLPYFNPHSFRNTLVRLGETLCQTPETFKAWSQNLGHDGVLTTFTSYGSVDPRRQGEIIRSLRCCQPGGDAKTVRLAEVLIEQIRKSGLLESNDCPS
ncbi:tyrosine-type recombinase/integrase [Rhodanobacter sp. L36]|uniref:tyrosine-type recombinase/integrase n=1 Tax=Rhodanobacter sp. L36 TaxID=1747221 RepID=UPI00131D9D87|nr:tyrosine-type recombinase/integrase [Rhodanobacter sp. L36]